MKQKLSTSDDIYNGVSILQESVTGTKEVFSQLVLELCNALQHKNLLWVTIPSEKSDFIHLLCMQGFQFHHCNEEFLMLVKPLKEGVVIPPYNEYSVGVGAIVLNANNQLLVIKDKLNKGYKLPGGHIDRGELVTEALAREVKEETGVKVSFESIVNLGHFSRTQFGATFYIVCLAKSLSETINIEDIEEIVEAKWMDINDFLEDKNTNNYNSSLIRAVFRSSQKSSFSLRDVSLTRPGGEFFI